VTPKGSCLSASGRLDFIMVEFMVKTYPFKPGL
jgi:hypothetical protein